MEVVGIPRGYVVVVVVVHLSHMETNREMIGCFKNPDVCLIFSSFLS